MNCKITEIKKFTLKIITVAFVMGIMIFASEVNAEAKTYKVTPKSLGKQCTSYRDYNKYTKHSFGLNYYMEKMQKKGGTLILKKGTYNLYHTVYLPSNVTIIFEDGVVINNIFKKGGASFKASSSLFMFCPVSKRYDEKSIKKYAGSKNVKLIGKGNVIINNNYGGGAAIVCAHNKNIEISGITFKNMMKGHFIELSGVNKAKICNNTFMDSKESTKNQYYNKEAINIDCDDPTTGGLNVIWSAEDKTPCKNITIENNVFKNLTRAVGTHKMSQKNGKNVYHANVTISNNTFTDIFDNGVYIFNWKNTKIINNKFSNIGMTGTKEYSSGYHGIAGGGITKISITGNEFSNIKRSVIYFCVHKNVGNGSQYSKVTANVTDDEIKAMLNNKVVSCGYDINEKYLGMDVLIFRGDGERKKDNSAGINFTTGEIQL